MLFQERERERERRDREKGSETYGKGVIFRMKRFSLSACIAINPSWVLNQLCHEKTVSVSCSFTIGGTAEDMWQSNHMHLTHL